MSTPSGAREACRRAVIVWGPSNFIYLFLVVLGLCCCVSLSHIVVSGGCSLVAVHGPPIVMIRETEKFESQRLLKFGRKLKFRGEKLG